MRDSKGFSLIELAVAMAVIAVGLLMILMANSYAHQTGEVYYERMVATQQAHRVFEQMRTLADSNECNGEGANLSFPDCVTQSFPNNRVPANLNFNSLRALCGAQSDPRIPCIWPFQFVPDNTSREQVVVTYGNPARNCVDQTGDADPLNDDPLCVNITVVWAEQGARGAFVMMDSLLTRRE